MDSYLDNSFIDRGLRGAMALSDHKDVDARIKVPRLECLGEAAADVVRAFVRDLFIVSHPLTDLLSQGNSLHILLRTCAASLIMYHLDVTKEFGRTNAVVTRLRECARTANITDVRFPSASPEIILDKWSDIIKTDYREQNPDVPPDSVAIASTLNFTQKFCSA